MSEKRKPRVLMISDSPDGNTSYGILSKMMIDNLHKDYEIHYCDLQYPTGRPIQTPTYIKWFSLMKGDRDPTALPLLIDKIRPDFIFTNFDIQHQANINKYLNQYPNLPWCGWLPWDSIDKNSASKVMQLTSKMDTRIAIAKFAYDFLTSCGVEMHGQIYNMIDDTEYFKMRENDPNILQFKQNSKDWLNPDTQVLLFVGRPNWRKRIAHLFRVVQELVIRGRKNVKLLMHTDFNDPAKIFNMRELIHSLGIERHVLTTPENFWFVGVHPGVLRTLYNVADIYLSTQAGEGFGMPVAEAMACGLPFVTTDFTTAREMAGDEKNPNRRGLFCKYDRMYLDRGVMRPLPNIKDFADKIEYLLDNPSVRKKMGRAGPYWVNDNCTKKVVCNQWKKVFEGYDVQYCRVNGYKDV